MMRTQPLIAGKRIRGKRGRLSSGSVLVIALWSLCILASSAVILGYRVRQEATFAKSLEARAKLRLTAEAGIRYAQARIMGEWERPAGYKTFLTPIFNDSALAALSAGDGTATVSYRFTDSVSGETSTRYGVVDEERKINLNKARAPVIERLLKKGLGMGESEAEVLAASIVDWRDTDSALSLPLGSAEEAYYRNLRIPYAVKNGPIQAPDELLLIKGMTQDLLAKLEEYATIYGSGKININTASRAVFIALGLGETVVERLITIRAGEDGVEGTTDDVIFQSAGEVVPRLTQDGRFSASEVAELSSILVEETVVDSTVYSATSHGVQRDKRRAVTTRAIIDQKGSILYWQES